MAKPHPPQPRLALRVGVTGHRPKDLQRADIPTLKKKIHKVLEDLKQFATEHSGIARFYREPDKPILRLVSALAEGADRCAAQEAISLGFELQCPLPFARDEYANDFESSASVHEYYRLLDDSRTTAILELDGSRAREPESYLAAGRVVLSQSDVLLAIWNGQDPEREGGTAQIVAEAGLRNLLTVRIDAAAPHKIYVRVSSDKWVCSEDENLDWLHDQLRIVLNPPHIQREKEEVITTLPRDYFSETKKTFNWGWPWIPFRNLWLLRPTWPSLTVPEFESSGRDEWLGVVQKSAAFSEGAIRLVNDVGLYGHYGWANGLAEYYGNLYRSAFSMNYLMGAGAVFFAFLHYALGEQKWAWVFIVSELVLLITVAMVYYYGRAHRWHERWIDYRLLAEYLRQLFFLIPLGPGELSSPHLPKYMSAGDPKNTWMYWHYLALRREVGMISCEFNWEYLESVRSFLNSKSGIRGQINYHEQNEERLEKLDARFTKVGSAVFVLAIAAAFIALISPFKEYLIHILRALRPQFEAANVEMSIGLCATALPAFGAALAGMRSQGEFERVKKRSKAMLQTLRHICRELDGHSRNEQKISYGALSLIVAEAGQLMVDELLDWRIVFKDRPLPEPG